MTLKPGIQSWFAGAAVCVALCGCLPSSQSPQDEQNEQHFLAGKARANTLDFDGAIEAFEKALEANPQNASAHYELGLLKEKKADHAAAIYHFERYLKLRPDAPNAQIIKERISADKMELSRTALFGPVTQNLTREFDKLAEENKQLRAEVEKWRAYYAVQQERNQGAATRQNQAGGAGPGQSSGGGQIGSAGPVLTDGGTASGSGNARPSMRTHTVKAGETPMGISRQYGVKLDALMAVNQGLDPRRMKVGQSINIPSR